MKGGLEKIFCGCIEHEELVQTQLGRVLEFFQGNLVECLREEFLWIRK